jgi:regulator of protease activity HflC (stomatin/prohibitin superfamily)
LEVDMAEISKFLWWRFFRGEPTAHVMHYKGGRLARSGRGLGFWFLPLGASVAEIPLEDQELTFLFSASSADFQEVTAQGVVHFRVREPALLAERVDFSVDLEEGRYRADPLDRLTGLVTQLAQESSLAYLGSLPIRRLLETGPDALRRAIHTGLTNDEGLRGIGLDVVATRVAAVKPSSEMERALQMPTREAVQQQADEATFSRRALAVEKERAIQENELGNRIELARREEALIAQQGQNQRRQATEEAEARRIQVETQVQLERLEAEGEAAQIRFVEEAKVEAERGRMDIYRNVPSSALMAFAARELASKLHTIEHLNVSPELFGPLLNRLVQAGADRLEGNGAH